MRGRSVMRQVRVWSRRALVIGALMAGGGIGPATAQTPQQARALPEGPRFLLAIGADTRRELTNTDISRIPSLLRRVSVDLRTQSRDQALRSVMQQARISLIFPPTAS